MEFVTEFEFNQEAIGSGSTNYKNKYLHVYKDDEGYLFFEIDTDRKQSYKLSQETIDFLIENKRVFEYKKLKKYVKKIQTD